MTTKPKILQVVLDLQYVGEKIVADLARKLTDSYDVSFCCLDRIGLLGEDLQNEGFDVFALGRIPGVDLTLPFKIANLAYRNKIDLIQAHHYTPFFYSALARFIYYKPKLIFTEHGRDFPDKVKVSRQMVNRLLDLATDKITSVCDNTKIGIINNEKLPGYKIQTIYNGIHTPDTNALSPDSSCQHVLDWIGSSTNVFGFLARLEWIKNPELLIKGFAKACQSNPSIKLVIMGKGPLLDSLEELCENYQITHQVYFAGLVKKPMPILPKLRALIVTSLSEAASLSILEAMMCGIPVIATDVGGNSELVHDQISGFLFKSGDDEGLCQAISKLAVNNNLKSFLGSNAKEIAREKFSIAPMVSDYKDMYSELL